MITTISIPIQVTTIVDDTTIEISAGKIKIKDGGVDTAQIKDNAVLTGKIKDGEIVNTDVSASANIDSTKLNVSLSFTEKLTDNTAYDTNADSYTTVRTLTIGGDITGNQLLFLELGGDRHPAGNSKIRVLNNANETIFEKTIIYNELNLSQVQVVVANGDTIELQTYNDSGNGADTAWINRIKAYTVSSVMTVTGS